MHLKTRHDSSLLLENILWKIPDEDISSAVLGRCVLTSIFWDNRSILEATCKEHNGEIDVSKALKADGKNQEFETEEFEALLGDSLFHTVRYANEDKLDDKMECTKFGNDLPNVIWEELDARAKEAHKDDLSPNGENMLKTATPFQRKI